MLNRHTLQVLKENAKLNKNVLMTLQLIIRDNLNPFVVIVTDIDNSLELQAIPRKDTADHSLCSMYRGLSYHHLPWSNYIHHSQNHNLYLVVN